MLGQHKDLDLFHYIIRVPKEQSSFTYFTLESNEGLCFYSTLEHEKGQLYRDIDIKGSLDFKEEVDHILEMLSKSFSIQFLKKETFPDS